MTMNGNYALKSQKELLNFNHMSETRNIGLIWANPYSSNLGVSALAYSALIIFEEIATARNLQFNYLLWGAQKRDGNITISNNTHIPIKTRPPFMGGDRMRLLKNLLRRPWVLLNYKYFRYLKKCDLLADTGEGDSYADIYGIERFRLFNYVKQKLVDKVPYILLPQTIGPFNSEEAREKAKKSLSRVQAVIARDNQSFDFCKELEPTSKLYRSIDMAFFLPFHKSSSTSNNKIKIGVNISGLLWEGGYTKDNQFQLKDNYRDLVINILDFLNATPEYEVHLIGHVISNNKNRDSEIDEDMHVLCGIKQKYPDFILAPSFTNPIEAKTYISNMDFFTGARMHACIAAISSGVPVLPMAYSRKFNGLFQESLEYNYLIDLKKDTVRDALVIFKDSLNKIENLKSNITKIQSEIIEPEKQRMITLINSMIK